MSDLSTSLKEIFNERISSPFYGSLIVSWLLWNWKIPYVTFFIDKEKLDTNKIEYILTHCNSIWHLLIFPLLSTALIILVLPYVTNYSFYVTAKFDRWRKDKQIEIDRTQLLTADQSIQILTDMQNQKDSFKDLLTSRDEELKLLRLQLESALKKSQSKSQVKSKQITKKELYREELAEFLNNKKVLEYVGTLSNKVQRGYDMRDIPVDIINYFVGNELIESTGRGIFVFTEKGKYFLKEYTNRKLENPV